MSLINNPFRFLVSLQHMVKVKIIETLWSHQEVMQAMMENFTENTRCLSQRLEITMSSHLIDLLQTSIHQLPIPHLLEVELTMFAIKMVFDLLTWLCQTHIQLCNDELLGDDSAEMLRHFIKNFRWDNLGCPSGREMLKSYVSTKDTINYTTWKLLCDYCLEAEIRKFSPTIDWAKQRSYTNAPFSIYWYWKLHKQFPTEEMFMISNNHGLSYAAFKLQCGSRNRYDPDSMVENILRHALLNSANTSALRYLRSQLGDDKKFLELYSNRDVIHSTPLTEIYFLGELEDEAWLNSSIATMYICQFANQWCLALHIEYWMDVLRERQILKEHFRHLFISMYYQWTQCDVAGYEIIFRRLFCEPLREYFRLFNQGVGADPELAYQIYDIFFERGYMPLCNSIIKDGEIALSEIDYLTVLHLQQRHKGNGGLADDDFCVDFVQNVLVNNEERWRFDRAMAKHYSARGVHSTSNYGNHRLLGFTADN